MIFGKRTWIVLGASSVMGRAFARQAAKQGYDLILLDKNKMDIDLTKNDVLIRYPNIDVQTIEIEPTNVDTFSKVVAECKQGAKNIISVFCAMETVYSQKECGKDLGKIKNMFQINYFSQIYFLTAISEVMANQKCGEIVVMGSLQGEFANKDNFAYGSTKAALHIWLQGFYEQMFEHNVSVLTVMKADFDEINAKNMSKTFVNQVNAESCAEFCLKYAGDNDKVKCFPVMAFWQNKWRQIKNKFFK